MSDRLPTSPATATPLLEHLALWGEVSATELCGLGCAAQWISVLAQAGVVEEAEEPQGGVAWSLSRKSQRLLEATPDTARKLGLFQVPAYRAYLVGILAEGLVLAGKAEMHTQIEAWTGVELLALLDEINAVLEGIEAGSRRLVDGSHAEIQRRCAGLPGRDCSFSAWDQALLGRAGRPQDLFDFALKRFAPMAAMPSPKAGEGRAVVLRPLPLSPDDGLEAGRLPTPDAWNVRRRSVRSGISLYDEEGRSLTASSSANAKPVLSAIQDALVEHPFYKAVVNLAICAWRSPATTLPVLELQLLPGQDLCETSLLLGGQGMGSLRDQLCDLVTLEGVRVYGFPDGTVPPELLEILLLNLVSQQMLQRVEDELRLHPAYQATLMAERLRTVFRPGKSLQKEMLALLGSVAAASRPGKEVAR